MATINELISELSPEERIEFKKELDNAAYEEDLIAQTGSEYSNPNFELIKWKVYRRIKSP